VPEVIPARGYLVKDIYYYLTPLVPLSFKGERGVFERGASPLLDSTSIVFLYGKSKIILV